MYAAGLRPSRHVQGDWTARSGYEAGVEIARRNDVTAVFCANDQMALGLLLALAEAGRAVPGDISVVGFDDIPEAAYLIPPLTTVRQDFTAVGRRAIEILRAAIDGRPVPDRLIGAELVVRRSSAPPPSSEAGERGTSWSGRSDSQPSSEAGERGTSGSGRSDSEHIQGERV
jgi:DNA-binding LacI/PurR family transcriptional regulator